MIMHMLFAMETDAAKVLKIVKAKKSIDLVRAVEAQGGALIVQMERIVRMELELTFFYDR